jgi:hypothetical protein
MQRMGGWEEEPPPPDDPRLGAENLARNYVPSQKPFEMLISLQPHPNTLNLGVLANDWIRDRSPLLTTKSADSFSVHSVIISAASELDNIVGWERKQVCQAGDDILSPHWSCFLADWMSLAVESYLGDGKARQQLLHLDVASATAKL